MYGGVGWGAVRREAGRRRAVPCATCDALVSRTVDGRDRYVPTRRRHESSPPFSAIPPQETAARFNRLVDLTRTRTRWP